MKKTYFIFILIFMLFSLTSIKVVYADNLPTKETITENTTESTDTCGVLGDFKGDLVYIFKAFKIIAPLLTLVLSSYEFLMAITSKAADDLQKAGKKFGTRLILVVILYLLPTILKLILNIAYPTCVIE